MDNILRLLNEEHYMGNQKWEALYQWVSESGEMGIYQSPDSEIGKENVYLIIYTEIKEINKPQLYIHLYSVWSLNVAVVDASNIARFANARHVTKEL